MISIKDKARCYGCYACVNACPLGCISMVEDGEGFRYPKVDEAKCTECGLCIGVCPQHSRKDRCGVLAEPQAYAAYHLDEQVRAQSAAGGLFTALADWTLEQGGVVFGVISPTIDCARHVKATTAAEVEPMRNSKYIPSEVGMTFREARGELEKGARVLFSGTPCQIAGLYAYLEKEWDNLVTCDLLCHGIPSQKVYRDYLAWAAQRYGSRLVKRQRGKARGWKPSTFTLVLEDGREIVESFGESDYRQGYLLNLFQRPSCYTCPFASIPRTADLSLGDYFAFKGSHDNKGLSIVTVNTKNGLAVFEKIRVRLHSVECDWDDAVRENEHLGHSPRTNYFRGGFFRRLDRRGYASAMRTYVHLSLWRRLYRRVRIACERLHDLVASGRGQSHR